MAKPTTKQEMRNFAIKLTDECKTREAWLSVIRFGMGTFLENQPLLIEIIIRQAMKRLNTTNVSCRVVSDEVRVIFKELGLRLEVTDGNP